ncbi:MAG: hypothetical protein MJ048_06495, partial [Acidaminococcaceae bacterium]|nr:hypothetical protein [Acidaminococcaceae bacterium]
MKGLECSEIHFDKINDNLLRLEAEYYRKEYLHLEKIIAKFEHLEKYTDSIDCGPFGSNMRDTEYKEKGILVVRPFNLKDSVVENDNLVYVSQELVESNSLKIYNRGTLLFSRVGDIKIGVLNKDRVTISPNIVAVTFFNEKMSKFSAIYFQSYYGFTQIKRQLKIAAQPTISTEIIQNLMIPNLPNLIDKIVSVFDNAQNKLQQSQSVYRSAEQLLLKSL